MIETAVYFALLLVLYATECGAWTRRTSFGLLHGRSTRVVRPRVRRGRDAGWIAADPRPWGAVLHVLHPWPLALADAGIEASATVDQGAPRVPIVPWDALRDVLADGRRILAGGRELARAATSGQARSLARLLRALAATPRDERAAAIDASLARSLDAARIAARADAFRRHSRWTGHCATAHFAVTHVLAPAVAIPLPFAHTWLPLLLAFCTTWTATIIVFVRAHRALFPGATHERQEQVARLLLMPLSPSRARDALATGLFDDCDPIVVTAVLGGEATRVGALSPSA